MGNHLKTFTLKWQIYAINAILIFVVGFIFAIFQYTKEFFTMYRSINTLFTFLQVLCFALIIGIVWIVFIQFKQAGNVSFYEFGFIDNVTNQSYFYNDILSYTFQPHNNKQAKMLQFETDDQRQGQLSALLPNQAYELFQLGHAKMWRKFLIQKIEAKQLVTFQVLDDVTSFKVRNEDEFAEKVVLSHEGIVLYDTFYKWEKISRIEVSFTGMLSIKDDALKTIWMEPIVSIQNYYDYVSVMLYFIAKDDNINGTD